MQIRKENITIRMETHISDSTISQPFFFNFPVYLMSISLLDKVKPGIAGSNPKSN